jgi:hypothetical protein
LAKHGYGDTVADSCEEVKLRRGPRAVLICPVAAPGFDVPLPLRESLFKPGVVSLYHSNTLRGLNLEAPRRGFDGALN